MSPQGIKAGDRVVELAALVQSAALITGAVAAAWVIWLIKRSWLMSAAAFVAGAALGFVVAQVVARVLYRGADGQTTVVKAGAGALAAALPAGLAGGLSTAVLVALLALGIFGTRDQAVFLFLVSLGCGAVLGVIAACVASLL
jgi:hypothetical protein